MSKDTFQELLNSQKLPNHDNFNNKPEALKPKKEKWTYELEVKKIFEANPELMGKSMVEIAKYFFIQGELRQSNVLEAMRQKFIHLLGLNQGANYIFSKYMDEDNWCIEDIELAWDHQQEKIDELKKLTLDNQARYNGALETIKALEKKIDVLQTTLDGFKNTGMIGVSPYQFLEKIQDLEERLKLKTTNEVNASVNADCLEGCRVKLKRAESKLAKAVETLKVYAYTANAEVNTRVARKTLEELEKGEL
jgi:hypothetical protein